MNKVAGRMKSELAQFRELAAFAQFASDLDAGTRRQLDRGQRLSQLLIQEEFTPLPVGVQVCVVYAGTRGFLDKVPVDKIREWKALFARYAGAERKALIDSLENDKKWDEEVEGQVREAIEAFNKQYGVEGS
jgi:F-type H+-transporting ATPase subunit alpha